VEYGYRPSLADELSIFVEHIFSAGIGSLD